MTGDRAARNTGAARPNSTADTPLRSRVNAPIQARLGRNKAISRPDSGQLRKERIHGIKNIPAPSDGWRYGNIGGRLLTNRESGRFGQYFNPAFT